MTAHRNANPVDSHASDDDGDHALHAANPQRSSDHDPLVIGIDRER